MEYLLYYCESDNKCMSKNIKCLEENVSKKLLFFFIIIIYSDFTYNKIIVFGMK